MGPLTDARWMGAALALAERGRGRTTLNPNVGCMLVRDDRVVGRGWTQPGGRPHAEAMALHQAGEAARGATAYVTLEPCAHASPRGPACADLLVAAGVARVVAAMRDPDPRTDGQGFARLAAAGIAVASGVHEAEARECMAGWLTRRARGRPFVTLKLATSLDGCIATAGRESRWITGPEARAHAHLERSRHEAILVGRGTWEADRPALDVRLAGLEGRGPLRVVLSSAPHPSQSLRERAPSLSRLRERESKVDAALSLSRKREREGAAQPRKGEGPTWIDRPQAIAILPADHLLIEGGARTAAAFLAADLVDRLLLYRAPILVGGGTPALADIGLASLADAHGRWRLADARQLGSDRMEAYLRIASPGG